MGGRATKSIKRRIKQVRLKIGELATQAGVQKSTVQHYLREGLLPGPVERPHRNVAYYSSDLVPRIQLIKRLQTERHLPLSKIKEMLGDSEALDNLRAHLNTGMAPLSTQEGPVSRQDLLESTGLEPAALDHLESLQFVTGSEVDGTRMYSAPDAALVRGVSSMRKAGFQRAGFDASDITFYMKAMRGLIFEEVAMFMRVMNKDRAMQREEVMKLAHAGLDGTNELLMAIRRKIFLELLERL